MGTERNSSGFKVHQTLPKTGSFTVFSLVLCPLAKVSASQLPLGFVWGSFR